MFHIQVKPGRLFSYRDFKPVVPISVYCVLPLGHEGKHMTKGLPAVLRRGRRHVFAWEDVVSPPKNAGSTG